MIPWLDVHVMASIERNHVLHSVTGIPPALSMAGGADPLDGADSAIFDRDPASCDILAKQQNSMRNI